MTIHLKGQQFYGTKAKIWWDSNYVEQKAKCEDIHEPRPKYHWSGGMPRLKLFELHKCLHATLL